MFYLSKDKIMNKQYSQLNLFIRSLIFSIYSLTTIALYSFVILLAFPFSVQFRHRLIRGFLRVYIQVLKLVCHIDYQVEGLENVPQDRRGIILSKHQSTWETFFLPLIFYDPAAIAKKELLWVPFFGWAFALSGPITINRKDKSSAMQQIIAKGKECLADNRWILVFPEGTRVPPDVVGNYRLGGTRLAVAAHSFVVPVAHNAGYFWPRRRFIKQPGTVKIVIGPVMESNGHTPEELLELAKNWIEETMLRLHQ